MSTSNVRDASYALLDDSARAAPLHTVAITTPDPHRERARRRRRVHRRNA